MAINEYEKMRRELITGVGHDEQAASSFVSKHEKLICSSFEDVFGNGDGEVIWELIIYYGHVQIVKKLLELIFKMEEDNKISIVRAIDIIQKAFDIAIMVGNMDLVHFFIEFNEKYKDMFNEKVKVKFPAGMLFGNIIHTSCNIRYAAERGNLEMVKYLMKTNLGWDEKVIAYAKKAKSNSKEIIEFVISSIKKPVNDEDWVAEFLHLIKENEDIEILKKYLRTIKDVTILDNVSIKYAIAERNIEILNELIEREADVNAAYSVLDVKRRDPAIFPDLRDYGVKEGYGHIITAAVLFDIFDYRILLSKILIEAGADVTVDDNACIRLAREYEFPEMEEMLFKAGARLEKET